MLDKPGKLTQAEMAMMRQHPRFTDAILGRVGSSRVRGAGVGAERAQADLEGDRTGHVPFVVEPPTDRVHETVQGEVEGGGVGHVGGEGRLATLRLALTIGR